MDELTLGMDGLTQLIDELEQEAADLTREIEELHKYADADSLDWWFLSLKHDAELLHNKLQRLKERYTTS